MAASPYMIVLLYLIVTRSTFCLEHYKNEGHSIMRRMAEAGERYEGHDVAKVHLVKGQGHTHKRLVKRDLTGIKFDDRDVDALQLQLSTGSKINLALTPANIVDSDTIVSILTDKDQIQKNMESFDCYSYGHVEDSSGKGWAVISHCDGVFGFAGSPRYDYFVQPVQVSRPKRETPDEAFDVHVMWRESESETFQNGTIPIPENIKDFVIPRTKKISGRLKGSDADRLNATGVVVEMAVFTDEQFWKMLHRKYPGREDDFLLTMISGTQALYGNATKVGYDITIKVKLLEHWKTNPKGYTFSNKKLSSNLRSFCKYTKRRYFYDVHALNTGTTAWEKGLKGLGYVGGACTSKRCFAMKGIGLKKFSLLAHELGHTLGMPHQSKSKCPKDEKYMGGFMGGGRQYNFSPCMKVLISKFLRSSKSNCLYRETATTKTSMKFNMLPKMFPGQTQSPDGLCKILAGEGYNYVALAKSLGDPTCRWMVCYNENKTSDEFGRAKRIIAPAGFPCDHGAFCVKEKNCMPWHVTKTVFSSEALMNMTVTPEWSEWSTEFSACSRSCGTGVRTRRRECLYTGFSLAPYCAGMAVKPELCNTEPCPDDPEDVTGLRQARGDEVCKRFKRNKVGLSLRKAKGYRSTSRNLKDRDIIPPARLGQAGSTSCLMACDRDPIKKKGTLDAFRPDGTPCFDTERSTNQLNFLNIQLRCVRGSCLEFTDCPDASQSKDECGICGGNGSRCVSLYFDSAYDVPIGKRSYLTMIPTGSTNIEVHMDWKRNRGVILELWGYYARHFVKQSGKLKTTQFAGTSWLYERAASYLRAPGPTTERVIIRAFRRNRPIQEIAIKYAQGEE